MDHSYEKLLSKQRARTSSNARSSISVESESDRARLVFSAPFRRLQQKAQVFSLEENASVRSRLTHSLEVAQIGRFLSNQITERLIEKDLLRSSDSHAFINFVEAACLMHDLGNPPFGHFGESAISNWFRENGGSCAISAIEPDETQKGEQLTSQINESLADFIEFDGNCQGLRIASTLQWNTDEYGLNLTFTSLASYLKYIRAPLFNSEVVKNLPFMKKAGFFSTEKKLIELIWNHFNYSSITPQRFPLAYIMEAADDIAYCISDLEDSIEKELLLPQHVFRDLDALWKLHIQENSVDINDPEIIKISDLLSMAANSSSGSSPTFTTFRTTLATLLTNIACNTYCKNHSSILDGTCLGLIPDGSPGGMILKLLKNYCIKNVYQHISVQRTELAGLTAIGGLLDHFSILLKCSQTRFLAALNNENKDHQKKAILIEKKLLALFPDKHKKVYRHFLENTPKPISIADKLLEWNVRCHLITDFISGMTDDFALSSYQMLSGIKVK